MRLYIAEKPSLGRAIANALPKPHKNQTGYIQCGNGEVVSWCIGHLLEQVEPDVYDEKYKQWRLTDLPILPNDWKLCPKKQTRSQLTVLKKLLKDADSIVHAGDPDREGQLLVDEVIHHLKTPKYKIQNCQRLLISDLNLPAVQRALKQLKSNHDFVPLSSSALARSRADWLYGMNMTRAFTLLGKKAGFNSVLSVGRVQTPILGLVVARDNEISAFQPHDYFQVRARIQVENDALSAMWVPSKACEQHCDNEGRITNAKLADNVVARILNQPAVLDNIQHNDKKFTPPLPFNLSSLQIEAARRYNLDAKVVLDICQQLYEKHKAITYPRSESRYLPVEHFSRRDHVLSAIKHSSDHMAQFIPQANPDKKGKAWNDKKVEAHHAIIPTEKSVSLSGNDQKIYDLVAKQYLMQFFEDHTFTSSQYDWLIAGGLFISKGKVIQQMGWKCLEQHANEKIKDSEEQALPKLEKHTQGLCVNSERLDKKTQPPKTFTMATLLAAMTGISRFVKNKDIKKILNETDGLGTEATRAGIIDLLFNRKYLAKTGKSISATAIGKALITMLPEHARLPDRTALWEQQLKQISQKSLAYQGFMQPLVNELQHDMEQCQSLESTHLPDLSAFKVADKFKKKRKKWTKKKT
jgi:DNA topoisomerase III